MARKTKHSFEYIGLIYNNHLSICNDFTTSQLKGRGRWAENGSAHCVGFGHPPTSERMIWYGYVDIIKKILLNLM